MNFEAYVSSFFTLDNILFPANPFEFNPPTLPVPSLLSFASSHTRNSSDLSRTRYSTFFAVAQYPRVKISTYKVRVNNRDSFQAKCQSRVRMESRDNDERVRNQDSNRVRSRVSGRTKSRESDNVLDRDTIRDSDADFNRDSDRAESRDSRIKILEPEVNQVRGQVSKRFLFQNSQFLRSFQLLNFKLDIS